MQTISSHADRETVLVDFALQGGGSHGAFTWGVLDRLLEEHWLKIEGISGTSAGAMNAAVLADGFAEGGAKGARAALETYWRHVSEAARFSPLQRSPLDRMLGRWTMDNSPLVFMLDTMSRIFSPYDLNPRGSNPLLPDPGEEHRFRAAAEFSHQAVHHRHQCAHRPRPRVFRNAEITPDVLLASACLPTMFQAIEIDGESLLGRRLFGQSDH